MLNGAHPLSQLSARDQLESHQKIHTQRYLGTRLQATGSWMMSSQATTDVVVELLILSNPYLVTLQVVSFLA